MKKILLLLILAFVFVNGCGNKRTVEFQENISITDNTVIEDTVMENERENSTTEEKKVTIIMSMFSFDENETIDEYVQKLNIENNTDSYSVYDNNHYSFMISESERRELLEQYNSGAFIENSFNDIFTDEQYNSAFVKMDYDEMFQNITFFANKENYDNGGIAVIFGPTVISAIYSDIIQAYSLVPIDERKCTVKVVNNETNEIIYDSSSVKYN